MTIMFNNYAVKKYFSFSCLFFLAIIFSSNLLYAQLLDPLQPEQDACNAIELCGKTFTSTYSYQGVGTIRELPTTPCSGSEGNSVWLKVTVQNAGKLAFLIKPIDVLDDYDFAVLKNNNDCASINESQVVRCNFNNNQPGSNVNGIVGLTISADIDNVQSGTTGNSFSRAIDAVAGDIYYIMINNFGYNNRPSSGFTIDFSESTATFANTVKPVLSNVVASCDYSKSVTLHLSNYALCGSVASDGSDFILENAENNELYPVKSANGVNCSGSTGYARDIHIEFQNTLSNGNYLIRTKKGSDGNSILGLCGGETPDDAEPISFSIKLDSLHLATIDSPYCKNMKLIFSQTINCSTIKNDGSQFYIDGPEKINIVSAQPATLCQDGMTNGVLLFFDKPFAVDGQYVVHSVDNSGLFGSCNAALFTDINRNFTINSFSGLINLMKDTTVCAIGDSIQLQTSNNSVLPKNGFQYQWNLNDKTVDYNNTLSPKVKVEFLQNHYLVETTDGNGCILRDTVNVAVETFTASLSPVESSICLNDSLQLRITENQADYTWYTDAILASVSSDDFSGDEANPVYHPSSVGDFDYYLVVQSAKQCLDTLETHINVKPIPDLQVAFKDSVINYGTDITLQASGADHYRWSPTISLYNSLISNPIAHPLVNTDYIVVGQDDNGCKVLDTVSINIFFKDYAYFPSAFTPNQDGKNDVFRPRFFGKINTYILNIYNRWGQKIYSSNDPNIGWNGKLNNENAAPGTYIWECSYQPDGHEKYDKKGTIVLIR